MHEDRFLNPSGEPVPASLQFSLGTLLLVVTLAATCLAVAVQFPLIGIPLALLTATATVRTFAGARHDVRLRNAALVPSAFALHFCESLMLTCVFAVVAAVVAMPIFVAAILSFELLGMSASRVTIGHWLIAAIAFFTPFGLLLRLTWPPF